MPSALISWTRFQLTDRVDAASFAVVRMAIGLLLFYDADRKGHKFFAPNAERDFTFRYEYFHWLPEEKSWSDPLQFIWLLLSILVFAGLFYRVSCIFVTLLVTYGFLLGEEYYLNHYYLLILVLLAMCIIPMHRTWSADAWLFPWKSEQGTLRRGYLTFMKIQIEIVLIYAGLVKLNWDWLRLEPIRTWLLNSKEKVWYGPIWDTELGLLLGSFGPVALHIIGAPLLLWKRTRLPVFIIYVGFHVTNHFIFNIGIFPWMTMALTTLFFAPDWPRRGLRAVGLYSAASFQSASAQVFRTAANLRVLAWAFAIFALLWTSSQVLLPLRHFLIPGEVRWTDEGHRFSWRMKLRDRSAPTPVLIVYLPERGEVRLPDETHRLSDRQSQKYKYSSGMIRQYARQLAKTYKHEDNPNEDIRVHAWALKSVNNRKFHPYINPTIDLVTSNYTFFGHDDWVVLSTPYDIRRIEDVRQDLKENGDYQLPPLQEMLNQAGLPSVRDCRWDKSDKATVCTVIGYRS